MGKTDNTKTQVNIVVTHNGENLINNEHKPWRQYQTSHEALAGLETAGRLMIISDKQHLHNAHQWVYPEDNKICNRNNQFTLRNTWIFTFQGHIGRTQSHFYCKFHPVSYINFLAHTSVQIPYLIIILLVQFNEGDGKIYGVFNVKGLF